MPCFIVAVDNHWWRHSRHHQEIRESQIDYEKVGWGTEALGRCEYKNDTAVTNGGDETENDHGESQAVFGLELFEMIMKI